MFRLRFIIAKCSQKELPYTFKEREGLFNSHTQYAAIKLKQFSLIGETASSETNLCCAAFMYYKQQTAIPKIIADFHFVLIKNLSPHVQEVKKKYQDWKKDDTELCICFEKDAIRLDLTEEQEVDPWKIVPLKTSQITNVNVTDFDEGGRIPHCAFECHLLTKETRIFHKVDITGATTQEFFYIRHCYTEPTVPAVDDTPLPPPPLPQLPQKLPTQSSHTDEAPKMKELLNQIASKAKDMWHIA